VSRKSGGPSDRIVREVLPSREFRLRRRACLAARPAGRPEFFQDLVPPGVLSAVAGDDDLGKWMTSHPDSPEETARTIEPDGWLHTGDIAYADETGHFFVVDRRKDMIITAGYNVYPAEIERVLAGHPAVAMVAVGPVKDEVKGELACAYVVRREGAEVTEAELIDYTRDRLAAYKRPRQVVFLPALPATSTGKIMRRKLADARPAQP
jgi:acyl-CoA synthetase (AMP-forming)/AMP-acid ligase II